MSVDNSANETKARRLEMLVLYALCAALLAGLAFLWLRQQGGFLAGPVVEHTPASRQDKPIDINTAKWADLTQIRGIGEVRAKEIIFRRDERIREQRLRKEKSLGFTDIDDFLTALEKMPGITSEVRAQMREMIQVKPLKK
jgi:hypothetical protein